MPEQYIITGTMTSAEGVDHAGIKFEVFDRHLPSIERRLGSVPQMLGEVTMNAEERFQTMNPNAKKL